MQNEHSVYESSAMCKSVVEFSSKKITFCTDGVSSWETLGSSSPLRIHLLSKKTGSSQDFPGSYYSKNSHLEQLQGACH